MLNRQSSEHHLAAGEAQSLWKYRHNTRIQEVDFIHHESVNCWV